MKSGNPASDSSKLLRFLQEQCIERRRTAGNSRRHAVIAATNAD
jgi:transcriptional regulator with GAF, ATPase, and Fis domain